MQMVATFNFVSENFMIEFLNCNQDSKCFNALLTSVYIGRSEGSENPFLSSNPNTKLKDYLVYATLVGQCT